MNKKMQSLFKDLEINRQSLFDKLDSVDIDLLNFKPDLHSWSILNVCHHLIVAEELSGESSSDSLRW